MVEILSAIRPTFSASPQIEWKEFLVGVTVILSSNRGHGWEIISFNYKANSEVAYLLFNSQRNLETTKSCILSQLCGQCHCQSFNCMEFCNFDDSVSLRWKQLNDFIRCSRKRGSTRAQACIQMAYVTVIGTRDLGRSVGKGGHQVVTSIDASMRQPQRCQS